MYGQLQLFKLKLGYREYSKRSNCPIIPNDTGYKHYLFPFYFNEYCKHCQSFCSNFFTKKNQHIA